MVNPKLLETPRLITRFLNSSLNKNGSDIIEDEMVDEQEDGIARPARLRQQLLSSTAWLVCLSCATWLSLLPLPTAWEVWALSSIQLNFNFVWQLSMVYGSCLSLLLLPVLGFAVVRASYRIGDFAVGFPVIALFAGIFCVIAHYGTDLGASLELYVLSQPLLVASVFAILSILISTLHWLTGTTLIVRQLSEDRGLRSLAVTLSLAPIVCYLGCLASLWAPPTGVASLLIPLGRVACILVILACGASFNLPPRLKVHLRITIISALILTTHICVHQYITKIPPIQVAQDYKNLRTVEEFGKRYDKLFLDAGFCDYVSSWVPYDGDVNGRAATGTKLLEHFSSHTSKFRSLSATPRKHFYEQRFKSYLQIEWKSIITEFSSTRPLEVLKAFNDAKSILADSVEFDAGETKLIAGCLKQWLDIYFCSDEVQSLLPKGMTERVNFSDTNVVAERAIEIISVNALRARREIKRAEGTIEEEIYSALEQQIRESESEMLREFLESASSDGRHELAIMLASNPKIIEQYDLVEARDRAVGSWFKSLQLKHESLASLPASHGNEYWSSLLRWHTAENAGERELLSVLRAGQVWRINDRVVFRPSPSMPELTGVAIPENLRPPTQE